MEDLVVCDTKLKGIGKVFGNSFGYKRGVGERAKAEMVITLLKEELESCIVDRKETKPRLKRKTRCLLAFLVHILGNEKREEVKIKF